MPKTLPLTQTIISIDPAVTTNSKSDETGIIVAARATDDNIYILDDLSGKYPPSELINALKTAVTKYKPQTIVVETNQGGDHIVHPLRNALSGIHVKPIRSKCSKYDRALPIASLYEQGKIFHTNRFEKLEEQMLSYQSNQRHSPDRLDALVFAIQELHTVTAAATPHIILVE